MRRARWLVLLVVTGCYSECTRLDERRAERCVERGGVYVETFDIQPPEAGRAVSDKVRFCARRDSIPLAPPKDSTRRGAA